VILPEAGATLQVPQNTTVLKTRDTVETNSSYLPVFGEEEETKWAEPN